MFSDDLAVKIALDETGGSEDQFSELLVGVANRHLLAGALLVEMKDEGPGLQVAAGIAPEPLRGSLRPLLGRLLEDCTKNYAAAHIQSVERDIIDKLRDINRSLDLKYRVLFVPLVFDKRRFAFFGFPNSDDVRNVPATLTPELSGLVRLLALDSRVAELTYHLSTLERYVKEVGHDLASAVQATVGKLSNIARNRVPTSAIPAKAREAVDEIMGAYSQAQNLGLVVDPEYNLGDAREFDLAEAVRTVVSRHQGEAAERHLDLNIEGPTSLEIWGDQRAIESAVANYLINAIKYANGGGFVAVRVWGNAKYAGVDVVDRGITVKPEERERIWQFGVRGKDALERHVNGSGIGLYSVRKIVQAHGGEAFVKVDEKDSRIVTFTLKIPSQNVMKRLGVSPHPVAVR